MGNEALHTNMYIYLQRINTYSVKGRELFLINWKCTVNYCTDEKHEFLFCVYK